MSLLFSLSEVIPQDALDAIEELASSGNEEQRGAVFTKRAVVEGMLDLSGYTSDRDLQSRRILEPSFGHGDFLIPVIQRLLESYFNRGGTLTEIVNQLKNSLVAVELHRATFEKTKSSIIETLSEQGLNSTQANDLVKSWLINDDFLITEIPGQFDFVVGNPPYVRQERIPTPLLKVYRQNYSTLYDRADLYILFFERGLNLLSSDGLLSFICANRWMKNKFGGLLREKIARGFQLKYYIDLEQADAFHSEVIAYAGVTVIKKGRGNETVVAGGNRSSLANFKELIASLKSTSHKKPSEIVIFSDIASGREPWLLDSSQVLGTIQKLEQTLPALEDCGVKVGIGVASGCDRVFIGDFEALPVEAERKLPIAMASDLRTGQLVWSGKGIVNPYTESGDLAPLKKYPRFAAYLNKHSTALRKRHTAKQQPSKWYKTIDRIYPALTYEPKLLIPDIKGNNTVVFDDGVLYPHHNLYVVTSKTWDLKALQAVLRSSIALMFVAAYCVRMAGGFLRFQAQYLRRIRLPLWSSLSSNEKEALLNVSDEKCQNALDSAVFKVFELSDAEARLVADFAENARVRKKK